MIPLQQTLKDLGELIEMFKNEGRRVFATSSFQTQSVPLLHILSKHFSEIPIIFLDTGFLFPETYSFKDKLEKEMNLRVVTLSSKIDLINQQEANSGFFQYAINPDRCCDINKVSPLQAYKQKGDVWISGVRRDQTSIRQQMNLLEFDSNDNKKIHPMLDWTQKDISQYILQHNLPNHPLDYLGYQSIGCDPCTHKVMVGEKRGGRWKGSQKTECGLHFKSSEK